MTAKLNDKVVLITGAGSGMGAEMAKLFAKEGAKIVGVDINEERMQQVSDEIKADHGQVCMQKADISQLDAVQAVFEKAVSTYGKLDILVNNAGVMDDMSPVGEVRDELWRRVFAINVDAVMYTSREAIKLFTPQKHGVILNISSVGGSHGGRAGAAYTASKHAVDGLTKNTAFMYQKEGIRVNAIEPGGIATNISESMGGFNKFGAMRQQTGQALMPEIGQSHSIAAAALFLVSDDADYINGAILPVDGGWTSY